MDGSMFKGLDTAINILIGLAAVGILSAIYWGIQLVNYLCQHVRWM